MIDIEKLRELVALMVEHDLSEIDLSDEDESITLKRGSGGAVVVAPPQGTAQQPAVAPAATQGSPESPPPQADAPAPADAAADAGLQAIESPMVGTFYASPDPDSPPFTGVGSSVTPESVVCLVEAMKVFNEIKADVAGTIERVCVKNGEAVEFGQPLFMVRPA